MRKIANRHSLLASLDSPRKRVLAMHAEFGPAVARMGVSEIRATKRRGGGAPKGASNHCPRGAIRCCHLKRVGRGSGPMSGAARLPALRPRRLPERPNAPTQPRPRFARGVDAGVTRIIRSRLSGAPRAPVVVPEGSMPGPPEDGVTSPVRRNRTRSIVRLSPATSLR